jgi:Putative auto-transporter adhesin, head GIN domain
MPRYVLPLLILAAFVVAAALAWFTLTRGGGRSGDVVTEIRVVDPFQRLEVSGHADVTLVQGTQESVAVEATGRNQPRISARVEDGTLSVSARDTRRWWSSLIGGSRGGARTRITVTFKTLGAIALSGAVKLSASRIDVPQLRIAASGGSALRIDDLQARTLRIGGSGALNATLAGKVTDQEISISGAGEVHADRLQSENAVVSVSGAGSIVINAKKTLRASISGAGSVDYFGDPQVTQEVSGVGRVRRREALMSVLGAYWGQINISEMMT